MDSNGRGNNEKHNRRGTIRERENERERDKFDASSSQNPRGLIIREDGEWESKALLDDTTWRHRDWRRKDWLISTAVSRRVVDWFRWMRLRLRASALARYLAQLLHRRKDNCGAASRGRGDLTGGGRYIRRVMAGMKPIANDAGIRDWWAKRPGTGRLTTSPTPFAWLQSATCAGQLRNKFNRNGCTTYTHTCCTWGRYRG